MKINVNGVEMDFSGKMNNVSIVNGKVFMNGEEVNNLESDNSPQTTNFIEINKITELDLNVVFDVVVKNSEEYSGKNGVYIEGTEKQLKKINVKENYKGEVKISTESGSFNNVKLVVHSDLLKKITKSSTSNVVGEFYGKYLEIDKSGVGNITLKGNVEKLKLSNSGVGNAELRDLEAAVIDVDNSGVGNAHVWATEKISGKKSGVGNITYWGIEANSIKVSGLGSVKYGGAKKQQKQKIEKETEEGAKDFNFFGKSNYSEDKRKKEKKDTEQVVEEQPVEKKSKYKL